MPKTLRGHAVPRKNIRIPKPMVDAVKTVVDSHPDKFNNRQQFIESAIREKLEVYQGKVRALSVVFPSDHHH